MPLIKLLGVAALALMALMAFIGASSATAQHTEVVLCKTDKVLCGANEWYPSGTKIKALSLGEPKVLGEGGFIHEQTCKDSHVEVESNETMNTHLKVSIIKLVLLECTPCTSYTVTTLPKATILVASGDAYSLNLGNGLAAPGSELLMTLKGCPFGLECSYKTTTGTFSLANGSGAELGATLFVANGIEMTRHSGSAFLCSGTGKWFTHFVDGLTVAGESVYFSLYQL